MVFQAFDWEGPGQDRSQAGGPILSLGGRVGGIQVVKEGLRQTPGWEEEAEWLNPIGVQIQKRQDVYWILEGKEE